MNLLSEIAEKTRSRIQDEMTARPLTHLQEQVEQLPVANERPFEQQLRKAGMSIICEVKKASPSKGIIAADFPYLDIATDYEQAGADALSVLTEPFYFQGSDQYLAEIARNVTIPILRKDFTVHEYMIYQAKLLGASAILLIVAILDPKQLTHYLALADRLGLSALVETHTREEIDIALDCGATIIGINNRNLKTFAVDLHTTEQLRPYVPSDKLLVSESGITTADDVHYLKQVGVDAILVGEAGMRCRDKASWLASWR